MIALLSLCQTACTKANELVTVTYNPNQDLEIAKWVCITIGTLAMTALVLYFIWKIVEIHYTTCKNKREREIEKKNQERLLLIDYRKSYLNFLKEKDDKEGYITAITSIIEEQKQTFNQYDQEEV